jgi:hypothetical protein
MAPVAAEWQLNPDVLDTSYQGVPEPFRYNYSARAILSSAWWQYEMGYSLDDDPPRFIYGGGFVLVNTLEDGTKVESPFVYGRLVYQTNNSNASRDTLYPVYGTRPFTLAEDTSHWYDFGFVQSVVVGLGMTVTDSYNISGIAGSIIKLTSNNTPFQVHTDIASHATIRPQQHVMSDSSVAYLSLVPYSQQGLQLYYNTISSNKYKVFMVLASSTPTQLGFYNDRICVDSYEFVVGVNGTTRQHLLDFLRDAGPFTVSDEPVYDSMQGYYFVIQKSSQSTWVPTLRVFEVYGGSNCLDVISITMSNNQPVVALEYQLNTFQEGYGIRNL